MATTKVYRAELRHQGLNKFQVVRASSKEELNQKCNAIVAQWNSQWLKKQERERRERELATKRAAREKAIRNDEESMRLATQKSKEARLIQDKLDSILVDNLTPLYINFDELKSHAQFLEPYPKDKAFVQMPTEPLSTDAKYNPKPSFLVKHSKKKLDSFIEENRQVFLRDHAEWFTVYNSVQRQNSIIMQENENAKKLWHQRKNAFFENRDEHNQNIENFKRLCMEGDPDAISEYCELLLDRIEIPIQFEQRLDVLYQPENNCLIIDYLFPKIEDIPILKEVVYVKSRKEFKETAYSESYLRKKYDGFIYQMVLVLLNQVFADNSQHPVFEQAVINGRVDTIDKRTGNPICPVILSISTSREGFMQLNLKAIDAKEWFKSAKGVSATSLANIAPVAPIISINKEDKRFIEGYNVVDSISSDMNLAAIDWQDFENLIRELFEKEFEQNGGEVRITQASRDGGVDAVAFDPDPIRGGKIIIQAKRYTNVVGVSAVRDLYGTLVHEGATKGILVTTSNYGNDAYEFAKGKPLSLLNGANLLSLLEKHGYRARIDLKEAKELLKDN